MHFVDFGNTEVISLRTIVFLSHEMLSLVPFAQLYCLDGVTVTNSELNDKVLGHKCSIPLPAKQIPFIVTGHRGSYQLNSVVIRQATVSAISFFVHLHAGANIVLNIFFSKAGSCFVYLQWTCSYY